MDNEVQPHLPLEKLKTILCSVFEKWHTPLLKTADKTIHLPDDFDKRIKRLLLAADTQSKVQNPAKSTLGGKPFWDGIAFVHTPHNMLAIANRLSFEIQRTPHFCYIRDNFLRLADYTIVIPYSSQHLQEATIRTHSSDVYLNRTAASHTANQFFNIWPGYTQSYDARIYHEQNTFLKSPAKMLSYTYIEGGNVYILKNKENDLKALVGADHLLQTFHMLELEGRNWKDLSKTVFPNQKYEELQAEISSQLTPEEIKKTVQEMFAQDLLQQNGKSGLISRKNQLDFMLMKFFIHGKLKNIASLQDLLLKIALEKGMIIAFEYQEKDQESYRQATVEYLTKIKITHGLIAQELGVQFKDVLFITQVNYHLDLFLLPGPDHSLFLNNYALCADILEAIRKKANDLSLSEIDRQHLERYLLTAQKLDYELGDLLKAVESELKDAGFDVIPTPGNFMYESANMYNEFPMPSGGFNINFMNAVTGWSAATGKQYYITHGVQVGEKLGGMLMDTFSLFLNDYVPQIEVYYIGRNPENANDFSEAVDWWNRLETQSGIHCTTLELEWN